MGTRHHALHDPTAACRLHGIIKKRARIEPARFPNITSDTYRSLTVRDRSSQDSDFQGLSCQGSSFQGSSFQDLSSQDSCCPDSKDSSPDSTFLDSSRDSMCQG